VLKVDVDIAEWPFLRNVVTEDRDQLNTVRQLAVEIHTPRRKPRRLTKEDVIEMIFYAKAMKTFNFTVFSHRQRNNCCRHHSAMMPPGVHENCCQETMYVKQ